MDGLLRAVAVFRGVALVWAVVGVALSLDHLDHRGWAIAVLAVMAAVTVVLTPVPGRGPLVSAARPGIVLVELAVGLGALVADGLVYADTRPQSLPWSWPAAAVMTAGILFGVRAGVMSALVTSTASLVSEVVLLGRDSGVVGAFSKFGLWLVAGALAGYVATRLRRAEREISVARAREEFARELHDGVLQTLAVIQRRSDDRELAALARDQEHDLRGFIAGQRSIDAPDFEGALRQLAATHERRYPGALVSIVVAPDFAPVATDRQEALLGAVGEALTNAGKHSGASKVTVYAEPADDGFTVVPPEAAGATVFVSVKDDGSGFDPEAIDERIGLASSIRGRIEDAGGFTQITSSPGNGTEVALWL